MENSFIPGPQLVLYLLLAVIHRDKHFFSCRSSIVWIKFILIKFIFSRPKPVYDGHIPLGGSRVAVAIYLAVTDKSGGVLGPSRQERQEDTSRKVSGCQDQENISML